MIDLLGVPTDEVFQRVFSADVSSSHTDALFPATLSGSEKTQSFCQATSQPRRPRIHLSQKFGTADLDGIHEFSCGFTSVLPLKPLSLAVDLLGRLLVFDPQARANCVDSLAHNYVAEYHNLAYEPVAERFDWAFSDADLPVQAWQVAIKSEIAGASVETRLRV